MHGARYQTLLVIMKLILILSRIHGLFPMVITQIILLAAEAHKGMTSITTNQFSILTKDWIHFKCLLGLWSSISALRKRKSYAKKSLNCSRITQKEKTM